MTSKIAANAPRHAPPPSGPRKLGVARASSGDHLYIQVARAVKEEIVAGTYPIGAQLPTEEELCARFSVSRYTVREALRRLREDNLIASRQGAGTIVVSRPDSDAYAHDVMSINDLVSWSVGKRFTIESMEMVVVDDKLAARTGLDPGEEWLAVRGPGHEEGVAAPVCWAEYYIHRDFAGAGRLLRRHAGPIFPLIEDLYGIRIVEVYQEISATLVPESLADALDVKAGTAALEICRSYKLPNGQVAQVTTSLYPATRHKHTMTLRRVKRN